MIAPMSAIKASVDSPLALSCPICLLEALRLACNSCVRVCSVLRSVSSVVKACTSRKVCGLLRIKNMSASAAGTVEAPGKNVAAKAGLKPGDHRRQVFSKQGDV